VKLPGFFVLKENFTDRKNGFGAGQRAFGFLYGYARQESGK
jgi:hypothetical protein